MGDNIRMNVRGIGCRDVDWILLAEHRNHWLAVVNRVLGFWVSCKATNFLTLWATLIYSKKTLHYGVDKLLSSMHVRVWF